MYKNKVWIVDNFLSKKECKIFINFFKKNENLMFNWFDTKVINLDLDQDFLEIKKRYDSIMPNIVIHWWQVVKWPENAKQDLHVDVVQHDPHKKPPLTSITYLNDDYEGGQTMFEDGCRFSPKTGRLLVFDGQHYKHGVTKVTKGIRYTVPCWYKNENNT